MSNVDTGGPVTEAEESARKKIADRDWIDDSGKAVAEEDATGVRYTFLGRTKEGVTIPADGKSFTAYWRDLTDEAKRMAGCFGLITLMGNVTNTWMGDKGDNRPALAADAIAERIALLNAGKWIDRTGGVGARVDKDALAQAVVEVGLANGQKLKDGSDPSVATIRPLLDNEDFFRSVRSNAEMNAAYARIVGRQTATVSDIFGAVG